MSETTILDAPSWHPSGQSMAVLVSRQNRNFIRVYDRRNDALEFKYEYRLNWQAGSSVFDLQPLPDPQWVSTTQMLLRAKRRGESGKTAGCLLLIDTVNNQETVIAKEKVYYQVSPTGNQIVTQEPGSPSEVLLMNLKGEIQQRITVPDGFRIRPFFFWNSSGRSFAFQATYAVVPNSKPSRPPGSHIFVVDTQSHRPVTDLWFPQLQRGYNGHGIGWLNDDTIVFAVTERLLAPGEFSPNPGSRFVLYQAAIDKKSPEAVKVWQAEAALTPMAGLLFWLRGGGVVYAFGRDGRDYAVYQPVRKTLRRFRFPEVTWSYSATFAGDLVSAVNRERNRVYWCAPENGVSRRLRMQ